MKIVMDNENVSMKEACRLMAKFTLNKDIADDIQSIESRRFWEAWEVLWTDWVMELILLAVCAVETKWWVKGGKN